MGGYMIENLLYKKRIYEARREKAKTKKVEIIQSIEELCKDIDNIKLLYDTNLYLNYKSDVQFDNDLRDIDELRELDGWVRKDHIIDIILNDYEGEDDLKIGKIEVVLFNIKNFSNRGFTMDEFDNDGDTFALYEAIELNKFPPALVENGIFDSRYEKSYRNGILVYIADIEIQEEYQNKGYGEYTLKYIEKIIENLFNVSVSSLVMYSDPFRQYYEDNELCNDKEMFLDRLGYRETDEYYYKLFNWGMIDEPSEDFSNAEKLMILKKAKYLYGDLEYKKKVGSELKELIEQREEDIIEECEDFISQIDIIVKDIEAIDKSKLEVKENDKAEVIIIKKYIELQSKKAVTQYINDSGYRIKTKSTKGERKYVEDDIRAVLQGSKIIGDKQVFEIANKIAELRSQMC